LDTGELHAAEPAVAPELSGAFFLPEMAQVRNPRHLKALRAWCEKQGVRLRPGCPVHGFERQGQRVTAVRTGTGTRTAGRYVLATGAWTDPLLEQVGWRPGIRPVRGQIALLNPGTPVLKHILVQGPRY